MASINVLFDVPEDILQKLGDGTFERVGGVIRKADDKQVVAWLTEAGEVAKESAPGIPPIPGAEQLLMGLQVANLAVSVVGFVVVYRKLQQVQQMLQGIDAKLDVLKEGQDWLDKKQLISHLAPMMAATKTLEGVRHLQDRVQAERKLHSADDQLGIADEYFRHVLGQMLAQEFEARRPDEFAACYRAWLMANQGRINAMVALGEMPLAIKRVHDFKAAHGEIGKQYVAARNDPLRRLLSGATRQQADHVHGQLGLQMAGAHEIVKGQALQLEYLEHSGLALPDLESRPQATAKGYAVCVVER